MIDTIRILNPSTLLNLDPVISVRRIIPAAIPPLGWNRTNYNRPHSRTAKKSFRLDDPASGYRGNGHTGEINCHQVSLPRLLHGQNGTLIKDQNELNEALALLKNKADEVCEFNYFDHHFTRVDLVWHFEGDTAEFILAHRNARHQRIRKDPTIFEIESRAHSLSFDGSELRITIYDKSFEVFKRKGQIVRVEVQFHGRILKELLGAGELVKTLNYDLCYQVYRQILLGFVPSPISKATTIAEFLAIGERAGWHSHGISAFDIYTKNRGERQIRRLQRGMAVCRSTVHQIDWSQLLPPDGPPKAIDLEYPTHFKTKK
jgi:hypothetical protein